MPLEISAQISIPDDEIQLSAVRAQGAGGQNVNKVSSAIHLRFDIRASSLPDTLKDRLVKLSDRRINRDAVIVIKAQRFRSQDKNRSDALERLKHLVRQATVTRRVRRKTKPSQSSRKKRLDQKTRRGKTKALRGRVQHE